MTVIHIETGYLEDPYLDPPYLGVNVLGSMGHQAKFVINAPKPMGMQAEFQLVKSPAWGQQIEIAINATEPNGAQALFIIDALKILGQQGEFNIQEFKNSMGQQANFTLLAPTPTLGQQAEFLIQGLKALGQQVRAFLTIPTSIGQQAEFNIQGFLKPMGMQYNQTNIAHAQCGGYLEEGYLEDPYLTDFVCASAAMQANFAVVTPFTSGQQAEFNIVGFKKPVGMQAEIIINLLRALGMQAEFVKQTSIGQQVTVALYNTTNLRILCSFPSRGLATATGLNAWGLPAGKGQNWKSNSVEAGDFSPFNLNTDIVEEVWRSNAPAVTGINIDCDTERPQGVFIDTFAILNHNITSDATVTLIGSTSPTFATVGVAIPLEARDDDPNIYYIAPTLPNKGYRYWRIAIDDISNPDTFIEMGTIIFGDAQIFTGECFVDQVGFQLRDYTDSVETEAYTNVNNSRAQKKHLELEFRSLSYLKSNFRIMRSLFRTRRTVLKCLWIPTPSDVNQEYTARFALFAKLVQIPNEQHNHKGGDADYVSFSIELDESK